MEFCAPCLFGIEGILADELRRLNVPEVRTENGRVLFAGGLDVMARVNIGSRYAERVLLVLGRFPAPTFDALFEGTRALPWEDWIGAETRFPVKGHALDSALHSVPDCQSIVKKAIVERLSGRYGLSWFPETGVLAQVQFSIMNNEAVLMLDTSGAGLHKRGYRAQAGEAPLKETLAAAIGDLLRVRLAEAVFDPCCGSGTLLIEAAMMARRIAPGLRRRFAAQAWRPEVTAAFDAQRQEQRAQVLPAGDYRAWGGDTDSAMLALAEQNARLAGVGDNLRAVRQELRQFAPTAARGVVLCNPPYGERMGGKAEAEALYRQMGQVFPQKNGWTYGIITQHEGFEALFGRPATRKRKMYNGMLKCTLYMYF